MRHEISHQARPPADAGIAIGPILFIIAVLGILAAAIAAGSGSFSNSTTNESNSTKAAALIDLGQSMKVGFDRITGEQGIAASAVDTNALNTNSAVGLFSPLGGGIAPPSTTMSYTNNGVASGTWFFPMVAVPNVGTPATGSRLAMIRVDSGVCDQINKKANGYQSTLSLAASATGDFGSATYQTTTLVPTAAQWSTGSVLSGFTTGCVYTSTSITGTGAGYYFFQVLGVQ